MWGGEPKDFEDGEWPFGGDGDAEDVPIPVGAGCIQISKIPARADEKAGEYSFGGAACTLPAVPGLFVDGVGPIAFPMAQAIAEKLIARCEKSPFGHNFDTKLDENVRKSWQLQPDLVHLKNPLWQSGIEELTTKIACRLGYEDTPLQCVLYKMLVYGEDGHFLKKEDGMVATLVIQLPSLHEGGDLVVYRGGKERYRHDFGKADGMAAFVPHYAVHYADAEHAVEKVTKGYRLVLVYSICLPSKLRHQERDHNDAIVEDLATAISSMDPQDDSSFAILLSHQYTEQSITNLGSGALKGIDRARVGVLEGANAIVLVDKKLKLFIVKPFHDISYNGNDYRGWTVSGHMDSMEWHTVNGDALGRVSNSSTTLTC